MYQGMISGTPNDSHPFGTPYEVKVYNIYIIMFGGCLFIL